MFRAHAVSGARGPELTAVSIPVIKHPAGFSGSNLYELPKKEKFSDSVGKLALLELGPDLAFANTGMRV